ncbi:MFS family permease [Catenulispora sp. GAS73]|uniref:MFS transporter n=1 Tax=Catenulispora sp. GAS73 TaxID=3156269 RepID=UPI0035148240
MTALSTGEMPAERVSLWRNRDFLALWSGQIVSTLGTAGSATALPLLVLATTGSATDAGLIGAATALPALLIQLPAGALVDRWNRLRVMTVCESVTGLALLAIPFALVLRHVSLLIVAAAVVVQRCCAVFFGSAEHAVLPSIVPAAQLGDAIAQNEAKSRAAGLLGPPLGGALFGFGRALPFVADALSSLAAATALLFVRADLRPARTAAPQSLWRETAQGLGWIWRHPLMRTALLLIAVSNMVFQALALILVVLARSHGATSAEIGLMFGVYGAGGMLGALAAPRMHRRLTPTTVIVATNWIWAALLPLFLLTTNPLLLGAIGAASAFLGPIWNVVIISALTTLVPDELRGRVASAAMTVTAGTIPLASATAGYLLTATGPAGSTVSITVLMLATAIVGTLSPAIRRAPGRPAAADAVTAAE